MKNILPLFFLLITISTYSQYKRYNTFSLEQGFGLHVPLAPAEGISRKNFINTNHFHAGFRYMVFKDLGFRAQYAFDGFIDGDNNASGMNLNRFNVDAVYNLRNFFGFLNNFESIGLLAHAGVGYISGKRMSDGAIEKMGSIQFGLMPMIKLSESAALFADGSFVSTVKQNLNFNGSELRNSDSGLYGTLSFGVLFYLGQNRTHADWH